MEAASLPDRDQVPAGLRWDIESLYPSQTTWEKDYRGLSARLGELGTYRGRLSDSQVLADTLSLRDELDLLAGRIMLYPSLLRATNGSNQAYGAMQSRGQALLAQVAAEAAFIEPELLGLDLGSLANDPALADYRHYLDQLIHRRDHVRSAEVEGVLAQAEDTLAAFENISEALTNADISFRPLADGTLIGHSNIGTLVSDTERERRRAAYESYADGFLAHQNTSATTLLSNMKAALFRARVHGYPSVLESILHPRALSREVLDRLLEVFQAHLPLWHRYWRLRKRALGGNLHVYDVPTYDDPAPLGTSPRVSFEKAATNIQNALSPLGSEYAGPLARGLGKERWVDRAVNRGKRAGAFSSGIPGTHPFILMSYEDGISSQSTLAHELGHSMHSLLTWKHQHSVYADYSMSVAETASNFNQAMLRASLLAGNPSRDYRRAILEEALANFHRYLFVMPTLARFELWVYGELEVGRTPTSEDMTKRLAGLFHEGYGGEVNLDEERLGIAWAQFGHLFAPYYVFQYATGISAANALAKSVLEDGHPAAERYLSFLKAGDSIYPLDALHTAGVEMTSTKPVEQAFEVLAGYIGELEQLV